MDAHYNFRILRACLRPLVLNNLQLFGLCEHLLHKYPLSLPKLQSICLAVSSESEHDRRMIAIAFLFVRLRYDCFKSRLAASRQSRLEAVIPQADEKEGNCNHSAIMF